MRVYTTRGGPGFVGWPVDDDACVEAIGGYD
jgi:hypothetical protein